MLYCYAKCFSDDGSLAAAGIPAAFIFPRCSCASLVEGHISFGQTNNDRFPDSSPVNYSALIIRCCCCHLHLVVAAFRKFGICVPSFTTGLPVIMTREPTCFFAAGKKLFSFILDITLCLCKASRSVYCTAPLIRRIHPLLKG